MKQAGIEAHLEPTKGGPPVVMGERKQAGAKRTLLVYGHYDVQPAEPLEEWKHDPFTAELIGDRIYGRGAVDEKGNNVTTHEIFSLLIKHVVEDKKWTGKIIKSISTTMMINRLGKKYGLPVKTVPVGFKYISPAMKEPGVLIGGEESGGFGFPRHIPERDGIFSGLLLLELMATTKKTLGRLVADLQRDVGPTKYKRIDMHLTKQEIATAREKMKDLNFDSIDGKKMVKRETMDGLHFLFEDESWLLFRASGTEPLVRIYAEAPTTDRVEDMLKIGRHAIGL